MARSPKITVKERADGQRGLFAVSPIAAGEVILTYDGAIIDHPTRLSIQLDEHRHIEGTDDSNAFLNHSCAPTAYVDWKSLCLRAIGAIDAGDEVTCNYLTTDDRLHTPFTCHCGAPGCKGLIRGFHFLSPEDQLALERWLPGFLRRKIRRPTDDAAFRNTYADPAYAAAYATMAFQNTYFLAFRDLPEILRRHVSGRRALDFGCGAGRSTRFLRQLGFDATGVDISADMIRNAARLDPAGDYRLIGNGDLGALHASRFDVVLCAFTFDNIPTLGKKVAILESLRSGLAPDGCIVNLVSSPEIYLHEWASFSTSAFPENRLASNGDVVRTVITDLHDETPVEDILWDADAYADTYQRAQLGITAVYRPLARPEDPGRWVNETTIPPWTIYVLKAQ